MNIKKTIILFSISILLLTGCDFTFGEDETISAEQVLTFVAETVEAALSLTPQATNTNTATATATSTATFTPSPSLTNSPTIQVVVSGGGNTGGQTGCDNASFVSDVTIPDGTQFAPGATFTKTWRMSNNGSCTWTADYSVYFVRGDGMSGISPQNLTSETAPGSSREISIELVAPATAGTYTGYWQLKNADGVGFGHEFYVQIVVTGDGDGTATMTPTATATGPTSTPSATSPPGSGKPDLRITSMSFDPLPDRTTNFTVRVTVENQGDADAGAFLVEWWSDQSNDTASTKTAWNVGSLAAKASKTLEFNCDRTAGCTAYDKPGTYTSKAFADATQVITENDESNNVSTSSVTVQ